MARLVTYQTSFADGQISPKLKGFVDTESYKSSVQDLQNMVVMPQGSITRRPGTRYVASTKLNGQVRLIPFNFGQDQAYVLEFGNQYVRFFKNSAVLEDSGSAYEISSPYSTSDLANLSFTQSADILFIAHPSYQPRQLIRSGDTSWAFEYFNTLDGPYGPINTSEAATLEINTTSATAVSIGSPLLDTTDNFFQLPNHDLLDGMIIRMTLAGTAPQYKVNASASAADFTINTDYYVVNATASTFQLATTLKGRPLLLHASTDAITISKMIWPKGTVVAIKVGSGTSSAYANSTSYTKGDIVTQGGKYYVAIVDHTSDSSTETPGTGGGDDKWEKLQINDGDGFQSYDEDSYVRWNPLQGASISWSYFQIDSVDTTGSDANLKITATIKEDIVAAGPNHEFRQYAWNSNRGWPRSIEIFQQRMCFGGNNEFPQTVWFSKTGDFNNFASSEKIGVASGNVSATGARVVGEQIKDDNAISLTISSATVDLVDWMISGKKLTVGTSGGVFQMYGAETALTITPFNFTIDRVTSYPTESGALPIIIDNNVIYVQKNGRRLRDIAYSSDAGGNQATDLTLRTDDIALGVLKDVAYQDMPYNLVWGRMADGKLIALTYNKSLNMSAWSHHVMGGALSSAHAEVESITVIPTTTHNQLWIVVKRTVNSSTVRYVEYMDRFYDSGELNSDDAHYVDSGIYTTGSGVTNLTGLNHLEGQTVRILADSALQNDATVSSGAIAISASDKIHAGLGYDSYVTTLDLALGPQGTLVGNRKKISRIVVKLLDTMGLKYGPRTTELDEMIFRFPTDNLGQAVAFFSGDEVLTMGNMTYDDHNVVIGQDGPFPLSILLIGFDYESNDL